MPLMSRLCSLAQFLLSIRFPKEIRDSPEGLFRFFKEHEVPRILNGRHAKQGSRRS